MNKITLRLYILNKQEFIEVNLDIRLSFNDNFKLLNELIDSYNFNEFIIIEPYSLLSLNKDVIISEFNIPQYSKLYLL